MIREIFLKVDEYETPDTDVDPFGATSSSDEIQQPSSSSNSPNSIPEEVRRKGKDSAVLRCQLSHTTFMKLKKVMREINVKPGSHEEGVLIAKRAIRDSERKKEAKRVLAVTTTPFHSNLLFFLYFYSIH